MIHKILIAVTILVMLITPVGAQQVKKPSLYLYFDSSNTSHYFKDNRHETTKVKGKIVPQQYTVYVFTIVTGDTTRRAFVNEHVNNYRIVDSLFVKKYVVAINDIKNVSKIRFDTYDTKRFPYKKIFIVEFIARNKYKVVEVQTFLNSNY